MLNKSKYMKKIGIDKRDITYRHFYYDDEIILMSNPPKYEIHYIDDENDMDYIECSYVMKIKDVTEHNNVVMNNITEDVLEVENTKEKKVKKTTTKKDKKVKDVDNKQEENDEIIKKDIITENLNVKYEYKIMEYDIHSIDEMNVILNEYGENGWELFTFELCNYGIMINNKKKFFCVMKRKK